MKTYHQQTLKFADDYDGPVIATLLSRTAEPITDRAVLYIHGYTDYFFHDHLADEFLAHGYNFYALDLRKYGRSLLPEQHPNFCISLREYYPEIDRSLQEISENGNHQIMLLGHSTGGLLAALYANDGAQRQLITRLVLNSPFFEFNTAWWKRNLEIPTAAMLSHLFPFLHSAPELSGHYTRSLHRDFHGEWDFNLDWKPTDGFPLYFSWLRAIRNGHRKLHRGLQIQVPILVLSSTKSTKSEEWNSEQYMNRDGVLNIADIARYSTKLGPNVEYIQIPNGIHDLFLSREDVRQKAITHVLEWAEEVR